jgi:hypothetical protein
LHNLNKGTTVRSNIRNSLAFYFSYFSIYLDCIIHNSLISKVLLVIWKLIYIIYSYPRYSWNTFTDGIKHQSNNQSKLICSPLVNFVSGYIMCKWRLIWPKWIWKSSINPLDQIEPNFTKLMFGWSFSSTVFKDPVITETKLLF